MQRAFFLFLIAIAHSSFHHGTGVRQLVLFTKGTLHSAAVIIDVNNACMLDIPFISGSKLNVRHFQNAPYQLCVCSIVLFH
jgi:hypothetical protein